MGQEKTSVSVAVPAGSAGWKPPPSNKISNTTPTTVTTGPDGKVTRSYVATPNPPKNPPQKQQQPNKPKQKQTYVSSSSSKPKTYSTTSSSKQKTYTTSSSTPNKTYVTTSSSTGPKPRTTTKTGAEAEPLVGKGGGGQDEENCCSVYCSIM
eukprot:CAMPEP_0201508322 /NCGR_PEP_ID=MMETSP0161_2-20130828/1729_1 /ASSEMBLY_ACC=CAM_ASM_000251 /TAXON_ID=180227 /ORGANISM="Neoparamoeba aestuarina, Strain SoJaBio B1-5/56/2" /LENGTH=151 /DNA_ID=CAMNT_0047902955 /DNA_START=100 /DNA_END=555 /DNA_ORIENTATION=+